MMKHITILMSLMVVSLMFITCQSDTTKDQAGSDAPIQRTIDIEKPYLNLPVQMSQDRKPMVISADGKSERKFVIRLADGKPDYWVFSDLSDYVGKSITITYPEKTEGFDQIYQSDEMAGADSLYRETNRPQFHFTSRVGWNNDPNGLVYYEGVYHLFYQHNPYESSWENMHWGHAVSKDLLHWEEVGDALYPDELGGMFSGSAAVDMNNSGGFQTGDKKTLIAAYTANKSLGGGDALQTQCIAYSNDGGMTWTKYEGNPVIDSKKKWNSRHTRDPKIFWDERIKQWIMVLFERDGHSIYHSKNLKNWTYQSHQPGFWECPELFELAVDGDPKNKKWLMYGASGTYFIGDFDGTKFTVESGKHAYCSGPLYAAQTYNNAPNGRRIQIAWGPIQQPGMQFNSMMLFPTELTLRTTRNGIRMFSKPIAEIEQLYEKSHKWSDLSLDEANEKLKGLSGDLFHVKMKVEILDGIDFAFHLNGNSLVSYTINHNLINETFYPGDENVMDLDLEILVDKTSVEIFADDGALTVVKPRETAKNDNGFEFYKRSDGLVNLIKVHNLEVHEMKSIWPQVSGTRIGM